MGEIRKINPYDFSTVAVDEARGYADVFETDIYLLNYKKWILVGNFYLNIRLNDA